MKSISRDKEKSFIMRKGSTHQEDIATLNVCSWKQSFKMHKKLTDKGEVDQFIDKVGKFNIPCSVIVRK